ncbi:acyl-CoA oxidase [Obba rivulosa]|uniref:Acyl-coenzyme A oxidase n=1 Tax=Obba rivulosa TaxID=1052685 RepID=A0A8E2AN23_9APHY|nr:acyl-CoA oxidase [Obba rivulosa]
MSRLTAEKNAQDMSQARAKTSIDVARVRNFLYIKQEEWEAHQKLVWTLSTDPVFDKSRRPFMSRTERYTRAVGMANRIYELKETHKWSDAEAARAIQLVDEPIPMNLHAMAFEPVITSQGSPELLQKYRELIRYRGILGCYLQTELGHGTNVAALETTATYLPESKEFEIHSPTLSSTKWWIGALGKTATHGVVQAKLILPSGEDVGPHLFFVQLRSLEDHRVLSGITIGDIGPKAMHGFPGTDNGFARFDHIRIPRENMLSKFAQVTEDGRYVKPPHAKLSYGGMMYIRSSMVSGGGWNVAKGATVAIRYATVRRQGGKGPDGLEHQVISYPSVHYRLIPMLSRAYVFILLGRNLSSAFSHMSSRLASGDTSLLAEMHATTSGLKVLVTTAAIQDLETARRSMGGHGFSEFAGVGRMYANYVPSATFEGDNFVLDQQVVRAALKAYHRLVTSGPADMTPSTHFLRLLLEDTSNIGGASQLAWEDPQTSIRILELRAALVVKHCALYQDGPDASMDQRVSKAVTEAFVAVQVGKIITSLRETFGPRESDVLTKLYLLYLLTTVENGLVDVLSFRLLPQSTASSASRSDDSTRTLRVAIKQLCQEILPEAIGLTDAFGFSDWELDSALGVFDGRVYEALYARAQTEPLNGTEVPEAYEADIKPMLQRGQKLAEASKCKL